jgi:hypothetical protein
MSWVVDTSALLDIHSADPAFSQGIGVVLGQVFRGRSGDLSPHLYRGSSSIPFKRASAAGITHH